MQEIPKSWNEFWAEFWRIKHLRTIPGIDGWNRRLIDHIVAVLELEQGDRVLDLACGSGEHCHELARRGIIATGIDIAPVLVNHAREIATREGLSAEFRVGDMRALAHEAEFDAITILSGSFGFFGDDTNLDVLRRMAIALKPGGRVYIQVTNPATESPGRSRTWQIVDNGYMLMDDTYDPETRRRSGTFKYLTPDGDLITLAPEPDGTSVSDSMTLYTLDEYKSMFPAAGLQFTAAYGSIGLPPSTHGAADTDLIITATKP